MTGLDALDVGRAIGVVDWDGDGDLDLWITGQLGVAVLTRLALVLAAHPLAAIRDAESALQSAQRACELSADGDALALDALAAAYGESGRFADAIETAACAAEVAAKAGRQSLAQQILARRRLYEAKRPYRLGN